MYKTVRHGENSLQYTILPQTEEVLNNSGMKGKGRDYSPSIHVRRSRRRSTVKYVLLVIFGVIIALALASVPLYVMHGALYADKGPQNQREYVTVIPASAGNDQAKSRKKELKTLPEMASTLTVKEEISSTAKSPTPTLSATVTSETVTITPWTLVSTKSLKSSTVIRPIPTQESIDIPSIATSGSNNFIQNDPSVKSWDKDIIIRPTVTTEPINSRSFFPSENSLMNINHTKVFDDVLITTKTSTTNSPQTTEFATTVGSNLKDAILAMDDDEDFKESLEVDEVFSLPSLKPDTADAVSDSDEVTIARWPFVDISSYFPWTGYSLGDNLLLPLLIAALSSIAFVLLLALAIKRRKRLHVASAQIGKLTADLQADDNTKLLTTDNIEDAEE